MQNLTQEEENKIPKKEAAIVGAGTRAGNQIPLMAEALARVNGFQHLNSTWFASGDPRDCESVATRFDRLKKPHGMRDFKGQGFELFSSHLPGVTQYMHRPEVAMRYFPLYSRQITKASKDLAKHIRQRGGVEFLLVEASCGGHLVAEQSFLTLLSMEIPSPELVVASIARPRRKMLDSSKIFEDRLRYWAEHELQGMRGVVIADNEAETRARPLEEIDKLSALAKMAPFGSAKVRGQPNFLEIFSMWKKQFIGIKAKELQVPLVGMPRKLLGFRWGTKWKRHRSNLISECIGGLESLVMEPAANLSGLPEAKEEAKIFFIIGDLDKETFGPIKEEWESWHGLCLLCPSPYLRQVYLAELFTLDREAVLKELGIDPHLTQKSSNNKRASMEEVEKFTSAWARTGKESFDKRWRCENE